MKKKIYPKLWTIPLSCFALAVPMAHAQTDATEDEEVIELNPFVVTSEEDEGYRATATLAGTRVNTDLRDLASTISVVTKEFMEDTAATDNTSLLVYTTNTEVGGQFGNYSGTGNLQGASEERNLTNPSNNTRVRGLDKADNTRNFFLSDIPWDGYNIDRVDLQRGPNSILFGVGSPSGIVNNTTIVAKFTNAGKLQLQNSQYGGIRAVFDYNRVLVDDLLAVRIAFMSEDQKFRQKPAYEDDERIFGTIAFTPKWFGKSAYTMISANFESGSITSNRPRMLTPLDKLTPWWNGLDRQVFDPPLSRYLGQVINGSSEFAAKFPQYNEPWLASQMPGVLTDSTVFSFNNGTMTPSRVREGGATQIHAIDQDGNPENSIGSFLFGQYMSVAAFGEYALNAHRIAEAAGVESPYPAANKGYYKDIHLTDPNVFNFYNRLIDGHNKQETADWKAANVSIAQTFMHNRLGFELVADYQEYESGSYSLLGWNPSLNIDVNSHLNLIPMEYPGVVYPDPPDPATVTGGDPNPNAGRAFVSGTRSRSSLNRTERENLRATGFVELRGSDVFKDDSFLARLIGRNVFTGLWSRDERTIFDRQWMMYVMDEAWADLVATNKYIDQGRRDVSYVIYLTDDLRGTSSPWNLNLPNLQGVYNFSGNYDVTYFDSHWNAPDVNPSDPYTIPLNGQNNFQSENWKNYVGLSTFNAGVVNAREGNRDELMTSVNRLGEIVESEGFTWQGYWWNGMTVPTVGWRKDKVETWYTEPPINEETQAKLPNYKNRKTPENTDTTEGETISWGVVQHTDRWLENVLPYGTHFSFFYNRSENFQAINRYGYSGDSLPPPEGKSKDYGVVLNTLDDRLTFRVTWYETRVTNASLDASTPLQDATWWAWNIPKLGTAAAIKAALYWAGEPIPHGQANYGMVDSNKWGDPGYTVFPFPDGVNDPSNVKLFAAIEDWFSTMLPQSYFDGYGIPIDTSKAALWLANGNVEDLYAMVSGWDPKTQGNFALPSTGGGRVFGQDPQIAVDNKSKGIEFELSFRPKPNWNIVMNAAKTKAVRTNLGQSIRNFIEGQYERLQGPAGDLRVGWGGDIPLREHYERVYAAYEFQLESNGFSAAEVRPWRFNLITNYSFRNGPAKGFAIGGALRWQDEVILGYGLNEEQTKLDVNNPIYGASETDMDLWFSYQRDLTDTVNWKIQVNLRNVGKDWDLIPTSVNPNGEPNRFRINEGMTWTLTNTFTF